MPSVRQGVAGSHSVHTNMHARPAAATNQSLIVKQNKCCIQSPSLPTPVIVNNLAWLLRDSRYDLDLIHDLTQGFTCGFRIPFQSSLPHTIQPRNHPSMLDNSSVVDLMIASELKLGRIAGPVSAPPFEDFVISPLGLIPKKKEPGAFRLIHDLSFPKGDSVNSGIPREYCSVSYEDYDYFVSILAHEGRGCYIAKADIESAFRIIPISPLDYHLLGFMVDWQYFYGRCLPMGCSVSCKLLEGFSCAIQWILQKSFHVSTMSHILDDFIFFITVRV